VSAFLSGVKRWWLRRFRGIVEPPAHARGQGTTWYQHPCWMETFECPCGLTLHFTAEDYKIISQNHVEGCEGWTACGRCQCPVSDARYVKICVCRIGHWKLVPMESAK
jgi:hypothetical protein